MKLRCSTIAFFITLINVAQSSINYKALIKDNLGSVIVNQTIDVQFSIRKGVAQTNVYQETHITTTDHNGFIVLNIGEGSTSDDFSSIDWGSDNHYLNVQIDTGNGLTDMGTTQFMAVPYALNAKNVSGLEAIDEGNGIGYRLSDANPIYYGNVGDRAVDLSYGGDAGYDAGLGAVGTGSVAMGQYTTANVGSVAMGYATSATGQYATAMGSNTTASGPFGVAMGESSTASGLYATAIGYNTEASGQVSTAMGSETEASGENSTAFGDATNAIGDNSFATGELTLAIGKTSTAMGNGTSASSLLTTAIGRFNTGGGDPSNWVETDPLFEIGNGLDFGTKSNALTVLKNGTIIAPSFDISEVTDNKALITKEYADANYSGGGSSTGLEAINEGNGSGWRLIGSDPNNYGNIGGNAVDLSRSFGSSITIGATGGNAFASGLSVTASGFFSSALGAYSLSSGQYSTAFGYYTKAQAYGSVALGTFNIGGGNSSAWVETDPIFEIGNGENTVSNALTVLKNGTITAPSFDISEITNPKALITKEYLDTNVSGATGLEAIDEGNGLGWRLIGSNSEYYGDIGYGAVDLSQSSSFSTTYGALGLFSFATGLNATASGTNAVAIGRNTRSIGSRSVAIGANATSSGIESIAIGPYATTSSSSQRSIAIGYNVLASGNYSFASGYYSTASGVNATAMSDSTTASGDSSISMGEQTEASGFAATAMGNITLASGFSSVAMGFETIADDQFSTVVGRLNDNTASTSTLFQVGNGTTGGGRSNAFTVFQSGNALLAGSLTQSSDRRLKKDIEDLNYGLNEILALNPKSYHWKNKVQSYKSLGLIAQDVQTVINEIVHVGEDKDQTLSVSYTELIPVLINAIKEQQAIIETQKQTIQKQELGFQAQGETLNELLNRVKVLEQVNK